ncbi:MAG: malate synthase G, partial [Gammaproteobacteria bacterium]|nr:malate synthase G [Gammaproteobacteria bacterium]
MNSSQQDYITVGGLRVAAPLFGLVHDEVAPGTGIDPDRFWAALGGIVTDLAPKNRTLLERRDVLQKNIDAWFLERQRQPVAIAAQEQQLRDIGYLVPEGADFRVTVGDVDDEISRIAGPQLVVPVDNSRYALNAANARWGSLYDALYGSDVIAEERGCRRTRKYNPVRGVEVIRYARDFLDRSVPLADGSHSYAIKYVIRSERLIVVMGDGTESELENPECFVGYSGNPENPSAVLFRHNELHIELRIGEGYYIGRGDLANIYDIHIEAAITTIMDCE